jgi:hypothetical protein
VTLNKDNTIKIPTWLITVIIGIALPLVTSYGFYKSQSARQDETVKNQKESIIELKVSKVDRSEFQLVIQQLNRIEEKIDKKQDK